MTFFVLTTGKKNSFFSFFCDSGKFLGLIFNHFYVILVIDNGRVYNEEELHNEKIFNLYHYVCIIVPE